jgi:hypothetical protein
MKLYEPFAFLFVVALMIGILTAHPEWRPNEKVEAAIEQMQADYFRVGPY